MALISAPLALGSITVTNGRPSQTETNPSTSQVGYDESHTYVREALFDHAGRPIQVKLPLDPDYGGTPPGIQGTLAYNGRGLPSQAVAHVNATAQVIVESIEYLRDGLVSAITYGDIEDGNGGPHTPTQSRTTYDARRRPTRMWTTRGPTDGEDQLDDVTVVVDQQLDWDAASNLVRVTDHRDPAQWNPGYLPQSVSIRHDALYRVIHADYEYTQEDGSRTPYDQGTDWRLDHLGTQWADPMREEPAPMATVPLTGASDRVMTQTWSWDYLANQTETTDDNAAFYERSLGVIRNGDDDDASGSERPTALYFAQNINAAAATDQAGWLQADYGVSGNLVALTVHAQCHDAGTSDPCSVTDSDPIATQMASLAETYCECDSEQHYVYRWDELNRLAEARRYDRTNLGSWTLATRQRYRYDGANQRTIKQTLAQAGCSSSCERTALYVYPGDFERRGLLRGTSTYDASSALGTETQYVVAGARMVLRDADLASLEDAELYLRDARMVASVGDLIGTTSAAFDVRTGRLVEASTYYPNGARETMVATPVAASEPMGFTGKEADEEVGVVYFGERYLVPRLGRWATPDPLHVHASGGGEALNSYHYVGGNLLAGHDPLGLCPGANCEEPGNRSGEPRQVAARERNEQSAQFARRGLTDFNPDPSGYEVTDHQIRQLSNEQEAAIVANMRTQIFSAYESADSGWSGHARVNARIDVALHQHSDQAARVRAVYRVYRSEMYQASIMPAVIAAAAAAYTPRGVGMAGVHQTGAAPTAVRATMGGRLPPRGAYVFGTVARRINIPSGQTRFTPQRASGAQVSAGWAHVQQGHFGRPPGNRRSVFTIAEALVRELLQSPIVVAAPVQHIGGGQFRRVAYTGQRVGVTSLNEGGRATGWVTVITDRAGNLITAFPSAPRTASPRPLPGYAPDTRDD